jgi:hypothetical protein
VFIAVSTVIANWLASKSLIDEDWIIYRENNG